MEAFQLVYIDDDEEDRDLVREVFEGDRSVELTFYESGVDALRSLHEGQVAPNLILIDIRMPRMDGFAFIEILRVMEGMANVPVKTISTSISEEDQRHCERFGVECLTKPSTLLGVATLLTSLVSKNR